jgi:indole-3-glycerol phosphate synthase
LRKAGSAAVNDILLFKQHGFDGFLIGENFMKATSPTIAFAEFVKQLKAKAHED